MSLTRFKAAQDSRGNGYVVALSELAAGGKRSHWIWYVFPQLVGLGRSSTAEYYGLRDLDEACDYLRDPVLGARLVEITRVVAGQLNAGTALVDLMGGNTDALKLVSSMTLFTAAAGRLAETAAVWREFVALGEGVLATAAHQGYPRCDYTAQEIGSA